MRQFFPDLIRLSNHLEGIYSFGALCFFGLLIIMNFLCYKRTASQLEKPLFWVFTCLLVAFSTFRPMGIARDDLMGYVGWASGVCPIMECLKPIQSSRDWAWYFLVSILKSFMSSERAVLTISGVGTFIQLLIIYRLCRHKLLALSLFIPLVYLYYDFTLLRAGSALTFFFVGFYFLVRSREILGSGILLGNYLFHSQGIFSIGIIPFRKIAKYKHISLAILILLIASIYLGWGPSNDLLSFLSKHESTHYWNQYQAGLFTIEKVFPTAHLIILFYVILILLINQSFPETSSTEQYALGSILLAASLAWFFAPIHAMQTRLFDFYIAPLVFLVGNLRLTRAMLVITLGLASLLYIRMELLHNWIIG